MYLDQKAAEHKEKIKRRGSRVIMFSFLGVFILNMVFLITGTPLQRDTEIKGRVLFSSNNHGDYLIVLTKQIIHMNARNRIVSVKFEKCLHDSHRDRL